MLLAAKFLLDVAKVQAKESLRRMRRGYLSKVGALPSGTSLLWEKYSHFYNFLKFTREIDPVQASHHPF
jgi:hypothetical protein